MQSQYTIRYQEKNIPLNSDILNIPVTFIQALDNMKVFVYFANGVYIVYDVNKEIQLVNGTLPPYLQNMTLENQELIAFINPKDCKLMHLDLAKNQIDPNFILELPTAAACPNKEKKDVFQLQVMVQQQTEMIALPYSNLLIISEERLSTSKLQNFEYIITVFSREIFPTVFAQFIYQVGQGRSHIKQINKKDTIIMWPEILIDQQITFLIWNVLQKDKGCSVLTLKENISASIISASSWGSNKIAFWANPSVGRAPEIRILQTKDGNEFKGVIDCFDQEDDDWMLLDLIHVDTEKNFAMIKKLGNSKCTINLISLGKFKSTFQQELFKELTFSVSIDSKYFVCFQDDFHENLEDQLSHIDKENMPYNIEANKSNKMEIEEDNQNKQYSFKIQIGTFETYNPSQKAKTLFLLDKMNIQQKYGSDFTKSVFQMLFPNKKTALTPQQQSNKKVQKV